MNATQKATIQTAVKTGFTYAADSIFKSVRAGKAAIGALVRDGFLEFERNEYGGQFVPTNKARDYVKYGEFAV
ncbi:hypothetical protein [Burkholderia anthina]|uniref:hypothetical protein n=1 Tax=Burkholderia anthina TaxID=179879 RepID=UPI00158E3918|nr:hypothetical protein [Burkholderia anthina]